MRPVRTIIALVFAASAGMLTVAATPASANSTSTAVVVLASPTPVIAGHSVTLSGSVGPEGAATDCAELILYSEAFTVTNDPTMAPVYTTAKPSGAFSATATIPRAKATGTYPIHLRCGGAAVGGGTLVVQEAPSQLQVSPRSVTAGEVVTVSGWLPPAPAGWECASGVTLLSRAFVGTHEFADVPAIGAAVKADGTFTVTTRIPAPRRPGATTSPAAAAGATSGPWRPWWSGPPDSDDHARSRATRAARDPPQAPIPTAAPTPMAPGPVTQPATPAADSLAGRWVVPGLAAVGASTLAAVGLWLGYRRRHLAGLSR
jgi:hypothetical protein